MGFQNLSSGPLGSSWGLWRGPLGKPPEPPRAHMGRRTPPGALPCGPSKPRWEPWGPMGAARLRSPGKTWRLPGQTLRLSGRTLQETTDMYGRIRGSVNDSCKREKLWRRKSDHRRLEPPILAPENIDLGTNEARRPPYVPTCAKHSGGPWRPWNAREGNQIVKTNFCSHFFLPRPHSLPPI